MATILPIKYALDLTGVSPNNLVYQEPHSLISKRVRSLAPLYGPFFTESVVIEDVGNNRTLVRNVDFKCLDIVGIPTVQSGKEVCSIVVLVNSLVSNDVRMSYQALGGNYQGSYEAIQTLIDNLTADTRPVEWPNLINRPTSFDPTMHLHRVGDVVGFEYLVSAIDKLKNAVLLGDQISHDELLTFMSGKINALEALMRSGQNGMMALALSRATDANVATAQALTQINLADARAEAARVTAEAARQNIDLQMQNLQASENTALSMIGSVVAAFNAQGAAGLNFTPPAGSETALLFTPQESTGLVSSDYYWLTSDGELILGQAGRTLPQDQDPIFSLTLSTYKLLTGGQAQIEVRVRVHDQRPTATSGRFADGCILEIQPFSIDNGPNYLVSAYPSYCSLSYSESAKDGINRGARFGIQGVDSGANIPLTGGALPLLEAANRIGRHLLDMRADYNVLNYGSVTSRRGVIFDLPVGSEITMTFRLSGTSIAEIRKNVTMMFKQRLRIKNRALVSGQVVDTVVVDGPDAGKYRAVSATF